MEREGGSPSSRAKVGAGESPRPLIPPLQEWFLWQLRSDWILRVFFFSGKMQKSSSLMCLLLPIIRSSCSLIKEAN